MNCRINFIVIFISFIAFFSCKKEETPFYQEEDSVIRLNISNSEGMSEVNNRIENGIVSIFRNGNSVYKGRIEENKIVGNGTPTPILPPLNNNFIIQDNDKVYVILNTNATIPNVITESEINEKLSGTEKSYRCGDDVLPMSGKIDSWNSTNNICLITRAMAKISVNIAYFNSYVPSKYRICNYSLYNNILYEEQNIGLSSLTKETTFTQTKVFSFLNTDGTTSKDVCAYIGNFPNSTQNGIGEHLDKSSFDENRIWILLERYISPNDTLFYRIDFYDNEKKEYIDIDRNRSYSFELTQTGFDPEPIGYKTKEEAWKNPLKVQDYYRIEYK